jgi:hypothetical protein
MKSKFKFQIRLNVHVVNQMTSSSLIPRSPSSKSQWVWLLYYSGCCCSFPLHPHLMQHGTGLDQAETGTLVSMGYQAETQHKELHGSWIGRCQRLPALPNLGQEVFGRTRLRIEGKCLLYQDNQSTIHFKKKRRKLAGPNSRHIDIR